MRLVPTTTLIYGAVVARDVLVGRPDGIPLLRAGVVITPDYRGRLLKLGIRAIYVEDDLGAGIALLAHLRIGADGDDRPT